MIVAGEHLMERIDNKDRCVRCGVEAAVYDTIEAQCPGKNVTIKDSVADSSNGKTSA